MHRTTTLRLALLLVLVALLSQPVLTAVADWPPTPAQPGVTMLPPPALSGRTPDQISQSRDEAVAVAGSSVASATRTAFPNCRLGAAVANNPSLLSFVGYQDLNLGAYVNFKTGDRDPSLPAAVEYIQTIRLQQSRLSPAQCAPVSAYSCDGPCDPGDTCCYSGPVYRDCYSQPVTYTLKSPSSFSSLRDRVAANPGSLWLVGNEPDRRSWPDSTGSTWVGQDETTPELYARAYCEISREIRAVDSTARVAVAGVVQGTPLRMAYLDRVWNEYPNVCDGRSLGDDVDVWNMHNFVLREASLACYCDPCETWGAEIPTGLDNCSGKLYTALDNASLMLFKEQVVRFRTWMRDKGERDKPLVISEGGLNIGHTYINEFMVRMFMQGILDYVLTQTSTNLGCPLDGNRLVQQFVWWSMDSEEDADQLAVDSLYSAAGSRKLYGDYWVSYLDYTTTTEAVVARRNLLVTDVTTIPQSYIRPTEPVTFTLHAAVYNNGNTRTVSEDGVLVSFREGTPDEPGEFIGSQVISDVYGCGCGIEVGQTWVISATAGGFYPWYVEAEAMPGEVTTDNTGTGFALIASDTLYLPYVVR